MVSVKEQIGEKTIIEHGDINALLRPYKTLRDPIHQDIKLTKMEVEMIDTRDFQRLRSIKQLGQSYLVYNGATHTRFDHAIGTLCVAQIMLSKIKQNAEQYPNLFSSVDESVVLLTRLCALLHDLAHIPFGHTLEDEGKLFGSQWKDRNRLEVFLGENTEIADIIVKNTNHHTLDQIKAILSAGKEEEIQKLDFPIVADIVGNTICADLLDYLARDLYYSGLKGTYDTRFLDYLAAQSINSENKQRLIITLFKPVKGDYRRDVVSELLHLLRLRYSLAERIYYHHAKIAASSMIIGAVNIAKHENEEWLLKDLYKIGDEELLHKLEVEEQSPPATKFIITRLRARKLYKPIYMVTYSQVKSGDSVSIDLRNRTDGLADDPYFRYQLERQLEDGSLLPRGSVMIYCPPKGMGRKVAEAKVKWGDQILPLKDVDYYGIGFQTKEIVEQHEELWKLYVFIAPDFYDMPQARKVAFEFYKSTKLNQELSKFDITEMISLPANIEQVYQFAKAYSNQNENPVTPVELHALLQAAGTPKPRSETKMWTYEEFKGLLGKLRTKNQK